MSPESIVVSLEWAKKLKEAGYPQKESVHYYYRRHLGPEDNFKESPLLSWGRATSPDNRPLPYDDHFAAPTAEEILRRLPRIYRSLVIGERETTGKTFAFPFDAVSSTKSQIGDIRLDSFDQDTLGDSLASLYCFLAKNNLLNSPQIEEH